MADVIERVICDKADLVAIADNVRACNGESDTYSVLTLNDAVQGLSEDIDDQADLISQIQTALVGKGSSGGGGSVETCTLQITNNSNKFAPARWVIPSYIDGQHGAYTAFNVASPISASETFHNVVCGSTIALGIYARNGIADASFASGLHTIEPEKLTEIGRCYPQSTVMFIAYKVDALQGETAILDFTLDID